MIVTLVVPTFRYNSEYPSFLSFSDFPTGYGYIAASLKQAGHTVIGLNLNNDQSYHSAYEMVEAKLTKAVKDKPDFIALGGLCTDYKFLKDAISIIRRTDPTIPIVLGGGIVTNDPEYIYQTLKPDYAVVGEGETAILDILDGIGRGIIKSDPLPDIDILPDYAPFGIDDMLDNYSMSTRMLYRYSRPYARPFSIVASRGCPFSCTFCIHEGEHRGYRARSIESVLEEIKVTYEKYHYNVLILLDELFAVNKERMREFCNGLIEGRNLLHWDFDWMFQTHASARLDAETLSLAKEAGCFFFSYGIESASPTVLKSMNKKITVPQIVDGIEAARQAGIGFGGNLIYGDPAETTNTIFESTDFFFEYGRDNMIFPNFLMPYPGSKLFDECMERGIITDKLAYYETIDRVRYNMTHMPMPEWMSWNHFIEKIAVYWWNVQNCEAKKIESDDTQDAMTRHWKTPYYKVYADCPYCGEEVMYRNIIPKGRQFMGVGCIKCGRKIKINFEVK